jgi:hypothetical protein
MSVANGVPLQDNNVPSWFIKPAYESRYPQIVSGGAGVIGLAVTMARKARVGKRTTARKLAEKDKMKEKCETRMSRSLDQHAKPYRAPARTFHCPMVRT